MEKQIVIVQPYVPTYRLPFFRRLRQHLANYEIDCVVAAGVPQGDQAQRGDAVTDDWIVPVDVRSVSIAGRSANVSIWPSPWKDADAVILGLEGTSLPNYQVMFDAARKKTKVGVWGHVKPYVNRGNSIDLWLEKKQMRAADHIFAYTPGGAQYAVNSGIDLQKITTVMNTVDTSELNEQLAGITDTQIKEFTDSITTNTFRGVCFIGGLDSTKRIEFLAQSLDSLWNIDPSVKVLIGGRGPEEYMLENAYQRKQAISFGYVGREKKAMLLRASKAICMPGRIGLVAVDALVARRPVVTTDWPFHAPEVEYLTEGKSRFTSEDDPYLYATKILETISTPISAANFDYPNISDMTDNFASGVLRMMNINA